MLLRFSEWLDSKPYGYQTKLAKATGLTTRSLYRYRHRIAIPYKNTVIKLCRATGLPPEAFGRESGTFAAIPSWLNQTTPEELSPSFQAFQMMF